MNALRRTPAILAVWVFLCTISHAQPASVPKSTQTGELNILTDVRGADLEPYVQQSIRRIADQWHLLVPEGPKRNRFKKGTVSILFMINRDGTVQNMKIDPPSNDAALDKSCWDAIKNAAPFAKLPAGFTGPFISVRFRLFYTPPARN